MHLSVPQRLPILYTKEDISITAHRPAQFCPVCAHVMGAMPGSRDAVCHNCGYKDPCCE